MELRQFRYFVAVAEELHFSRAAARLNIGQPPLSLQIQAIERELGVTLLKRNRRRVELTDAGRLFLKEARAALDQAGHAIDVARRAARGEIGTLRLSFTTSAPLTAIFARAIRTYRESLPEVHIELRIRTTQQILDALMTANLDVGMIRPAAPATIPAGITAVRIHSDRLMLVLPASHRLAAHAGAIPLALVAREKFVLRPLGSGAGYYEQVFDLCNRAGFVPEIIQEASEPPTTFGLVAAGLGITMAPASLRAIQVDEIVWRDIDVGERAISALLLVYRSEPENPLRDRFVSIARAEARQIRGRA